KIKINKKESLITSGLPRILAIALVYLIGIMIITITFSYVIPKINYEFHKFSSNFPNIISQTKSAFENFYFNQIYPFLPQTGRDYLASILNSLSEAVKHIGNSILQKSIPVVIKFFSIVAGFFIVPLITFYILMDVEIYKKGFLLIVPKRMRDDILELLARIDKVLGRYIRGQLIVCLCIGISVTIALKIWKIDYAFLIGAFAGIVDLIPYLGVVIGLIPALILALIKSPLIALGVLATLLVIHWSEGHIIVPLVVGQSLKLPALIIIISLLIGAELMGIAGMFLAVPVAAILRVLINYYIVEKKENIEKNPS
ncbi:MAG: AI-2E family transporter, partial [Armatimonadetes bacterium]|nr:AI-2E family transporter [Armatimonadota bacterium]